MLLRELKNRNKRRVVMTFPLNPDVHGDQGIALAAGLKAQAADELKIPVMRMGDDKVDFVTVSCDLPVAQGRFCGAEGIDPERMRFLSDHVGTEFGLHYGTLIPTLRIHSRAVFVVGPDDTLRHVEYVPEVADEPNYDAALEAARSA